MKLSIKAALCLTAAVALHALPATAGDPVRGETVFGQCAGCHAVGENAAHRFGPTLNGLFERDVASADGFAYSDAIKKAADAGLVWNPETMDAFLKAPMANIPGTKMVYPGLANEQDRQDVIAWLATINSQGVISTEEGAVGEAPQATAETATTIENKPRTLARDTSVPSHGVLHLGRVAMQEEITAWDIDVRPDGHGLPVGLGSALDGAELYDAQCAYCHGVFGEGEGRWPILAGGHGTLTEDRPEKTIGSYWPYLSTVYDYVRRAMPFGNARSLTDDQVYAITAYLLYLNDLVDEDFTLSAENFDQIRLPNENNFIDDNRSDEPSFKSAGEPCMSDCTDGEVRVTQRARILDVTPDSDEPDGIAVIE